MTLRVAIVGTGPTGIYSFKGLIDSGGAASVTLFERGSQAGVGMPYSPQTATRAMLANIASIEIPEIVDSYLDWMNGQSPGKLQGYGLDPDDLDDRLFTPRLLLGEYFRDQFLALVDRARKAGIAVTVQEDADVIDVAAVPGGIEVRCAKGPETAVFDRVILATGHDFPDADAARRTYFPSPWSGLIQAEVPAVRVGIMGTSLSSIDAGLAVAMQHGRFRRSGGELVFQTAAKGLHLTLMSWTGVLPEADFYCPLPYEPLALLTDAAVAECGGDPTPLDAAFALFRAELGRADPAYALQIGLPNLTPDSFAAAYFAARERHDPFRWARRNLDEVEHNKARQITVPWRYVLLRMHEKFERLVPYLDDRDRARFDEGLKKVFVDNYAAVPPESIRRLLALRDAGVLSVLALGTDYTLKTGRRTTTVTAKGRKHAFDIFIDARGQKALTAEDLPFPALRSALLGAGQSIPELAEDFSLVGVPGYAGRLVMAAIPYLMHDRPFVQGITASAEIGAEVARGLTGSGRRRRQTA